MKEVYLIELNWLEVKLFKGWDCKLLAFIISINNGIFIEFYAISLFKLHTVIIYTQLFFHSYLIWRFWNENLMGFAGLGIPFRRTFTSSRLSGVDSTKLWSIFAKMIFSSIIASFFPL